MTWAICGLLGTGERAGSGTCQQLVPSAPTRETRTRGQDRVPVNSSSQALPPAKPETEVRIGYLSTARPKRSHPRNQESRHATTTRTIDIMVVGTSPVQSSLCTSQLKVALSTAVGNKVTKTVPREATVDIRSKPILSSSQRECPAPPPYFSGHCLK